MTGMPAFELTSPSDLPAPAGYSHVAAIPSGSRLVWTSGQLPLTADGDLAGAGDWEAQTRAVMENLTRALAAGGAGWPDVFKLTFYVTDTAALPVVRSVRDEFVDTARPPASTLVAVAGLARPDALIEIEAVAAI
jgi:enamine deaminase RidA (YjgF/YER057c/UK114 family)